MKNFYIIAAIVGAIIPYYFVALFFIKNGFNISLFFQELLSTNASLNFVTDFVIASFVFWIFVFKEAKRFNSPSPWLFVFINLGIGLSCALPLFLYFREKNKSLVDIRN